MSVWTTSPLVVGHRGGRGDGWPRENSLDAFEQARRQGAAAIELDVRTSAAGEVVVEHDATLTRRSAGDDTRRVRDVSVHELGAMGIPTLTEVLSWAGSSGVAVNVEMKHDVASRVELVRGTVRAVRAIEADVLLSSFDPLLLAMAAWIAPALPRALLVHAGQPAWADLAQQMARPPWVRALHLERVQTAPTAIARHLRRGLRLGAWTVNDPREAVRLVDLGVAAIITDAPGAIIEALRLHSQSTGSMRTPGGGAG